MNSTKQGQSSPVPDFYIALGIMIAVGAPVLYAVASYEKSNNKVEEITTRQYLSIQNDAHLSGPKFREEVIQALHNNVITKEEYISLRTSLAETPKAEVIGKIRAYSNNQREEY